MNSEIEKIFLELSEVEKIEFLKSALEKNTFLAEQFIAKYGHLKTLKSDRVKLGLGDYLAMVEKEKETLLTSFANIDFDNLDWDSYSPRSTGYEPEYEVRENLAEEEIQQWIESVFASAEKTVNCGNLCETLVNLISLYHAIHEIKSEELDDFFGDSLDVMLSIFFPALEKTTKQVGSVIFSHEEIKLGAEFLFTCFKENMNGLEAFEPLLINVCETPETAMHMNNLMSKLKISEHLVPELKLEIFEKLGKEPEWNELAGRCMNERFSIAEKLLNKYLRTHPEKLSQVAKEAFNNFPDEAGSWILENFPPQNNPELFKTVLWAEAYSNCDKDLFIKLKPMLNEKDIDEFIQEIPDHETVFIVEILNIEKRYHEILDLVKKNTQSWNFDELIHPILNIFPKECFEIISKKIHYNLIHKRGRDYYKRMATRMKILQSLPEIGVQTEKLIQEVWNYKPNLPALKDEMRKAGLRK